LDLIEPESDYNSTEKPLSSPAVGLVIPSPPVGRFVYWLDQKPADQSRRQLLILASAPTIAKCLSLWPALHRTESIDTSMTSSMMSCQQTYLWMRLLKTRMPDVTATRREHIDTGDSRKLFKYATSTMV
jgi:hypothetical protein